MKKIKNIKHIFWLLSLVFSIVSCDSFLVEDPQAQISTSNYYKTEADAIAAVNSIYSWLGSYDLALGGGTSGIYHSTFWLIQGLAADELLTQRPGFPQLSALATLAHNSENSSLLEVWRMHYKVITVANLAIARIPSIDMNETLRERLVNESKYLRGLMYFNLVRMFGNIPLLVQENETIQPEAASIDLVYAQIIQDLTDAEKLPLSYAIGSGKGRATSGAAKATLAKVYLTKGEYQRAADKALEVINEKQYDLFEDFADIWKYGNRNGKEVVFSIGFGTGGGRISFWEVAAFNVQLLPAELSGNIPGITNTRGWHYSTEDLYNSFDPADERRAVTFMKDITRPNNSVLVLNKTYVKKYWDKDANPTTRPSESDFPVIRYSDVLLMYAEAQGELGNFDEANKYLRKVRERANITHVDIKDKIAFREATLDERRKEFVAEGHRWFDLVRMGKLEMKVQQAKGITPSRDYYLFPIPLRERDLNPNLPQNPGY